MSFLRGHASHLIRRLNGGARWRRKRAGIVAACAVACLSTGALAQEDGPAADAGPAGGLALADAVEIALSSNPHYAAMLAQARALCRRSRRRPAPCRIRPSAWPR